MKLISVKQFNQEQNTKFNEACQSHEYGKGGFPFRPMYVFQTPEGEDRQRGYVATSENKHCFGMNKDKAIANFNN